MKYRNQTPENRTIISGFWSDLMDIFRSSFKDNGGTDTSLKVTTVNDQTIEQSLADAFRDNKESNDLILKELRLLNMRIEEAFDTRINREDI